MMKIIRKKYTTKVFHKLRISVWIAGIFLITIRVSYGQEEMCALPEESFDMMAKQMDLGDAEAENNFPTSGTVNALIIFVQHQNDDYEDCKELTGYSSLGVPTFSSSTYTNDCENRSGDSWQPGGYQSWTDDATSEWPVDLPAGPDADHTRELPDWAEDLIDPPGSTSFTEGSLSDFYNKVSNGALTLTGEVWDYVYIPDTTSHVYDTDRLPFDNGALKLSREIIEYVDDNRHGINLDASHWDLYTNGDGSDSDPDGNFDMIILVYRFSHLQLMTDDNSVPGQSIPADNITSLGDFSNNPNMDRLAPSPLQSLQLGSYNVRDNTINGSGVITNAQTQKAALRIIGHEIGHRQFGLYHTDDVDGDIFSDPELEQTDFYSIMNGSAHMGVSAPDRIKVEWANVQNVDVTSISGSQAYTLRDALVVNSTEIDAIRFRNGTTDACGDIIVEARLQDHFLDKPPGTGNDDDGDGADFYLPNEGLLVYKAAQSGTGGCGSIFVRYSSMPNGGLTTRRKYFGSDANNPAGMHEPAFGPGDNYTPFTTIQHDFHDSPLDSEIAITDISISGNSVSFKVWEDFPQEVGGGTKRFVAPYAFDSEAVARISTWSLDGVFSQNDDMFIEEGVTINLGSNGQILNLADDIEARGSVSSPVVLNGGDYVITTSTAVFENVEPNMSSLVIQGNSDVSFYAQSDIVFSGDLEVNVGSNLLISPGAAPPSMPATIEEFELQEIEEEFTEISISDGSLDENLDIPDIGTDGHEIDLEINNYPNPFNPTTTLSYSLPEDTWVDIKVFDMLGREIALLVNEFQSQGTRSVVWDASSRGELPSGVYLYKLEANGQTKMGKMLLVK